MKAGAAVPGMQRPAGHYIFRYNRVNMRDIQKWNVGYSMFAGFAANLPRYPDEDDVQRYHEIVTVLEQASGHDLTHFRIVADKLKRRITSMRPGGYSGGPGHATYSDKRYCDSNHFRAQVDGLANYLRSIQNDAEGASQASDTNPYESLSDYQLEEMLVKRRLKPKRVIDQGRERYVFDRAHAIASLLKSDGKEAPAGPMQSTVINVRDSTVIHSSPGASITQNTGFSSAEFRVLIDAVKQLTSSQELSEGNRGQIATDIGTVELQVNSARPNPTIIRECMLSVRTILENAAGSLLASSLLAAINRYFP